MRTYTVSFRKVIVLAASGDQDLLVFVPAANKPIKLLGLVLSSSDPSNNEEQLPVDIIRGFGSLTTGGVSITPRPVNTTATPGFNALGVATGSPTVLGSGGTPHFLHSDGWNVHGPYGPWIWPPEMQFECSAGLGVNLVIRLGQPNGDLILSATAYVGEEG